MRSLIASRSIKTPSFVLGLTILLTWIAVAVLATEVAPYDPVQTVGGARQPPSFEFWFGTDRLGRDVFNRVIFGARVSLLLGLISVVMGSVIGSTLGLVSGYYSGWLDTLIMRMLAFPGILLALVIIAAVGPSIENVMVAVGISTVPVYARLIRSTVMSLREQPYIDAARILGVRDLKIMLRHVLPNTVAPLLVLSTLQIGNAISMGAGLSFLAMGAQPPTAEWGLMAAVGRTILGRAWWISTFPGLAILTVVMACNLLGDSVRTILDPRLRSR